MASRRENWNGRVEMPGVHLTHDAQRQGGFPSQITFADGKVFDSLRWNDRLFHRPSGSFSLPTDRQAKVTLVSQGPLCTAVWIIGRYVQANGKAPPSAPQAVYDWLYLADPAAGAGAGRATAAGALYVARSAFSGAGLSPGGVSPLGRR